MKKIITKFWGVALVVILLSSLFVFAAAPASAADPLQWNRASIPGAVGNVLTSGFTIKDIAINGDTVYAVGSTSTDTAVVYKSTNGGSTWSMNDDTNTLLGIVTTDLVAVAPDDPNIVVLINSTNTTNEAWVTTTGGAIWSTLNLATGAAGFTAPVRSVAISPAVFGTHYVAVAANDMYYFNLGAAAPTWTDMRNGGPWAAGTPPTAANTYYAVAFSPNFASDYIMLAVSKNGTTAIQLNAASFNSFRWNTEIGYFESYPANIVTGTGLAVTKASLAVSPDYSGGDDTLRTSFVGLDFTGTSSTTNGIVRMSNYIPKQIMATATAINSVDYNGSVLVAGQYDTNTSWYCTDPLAVTPTVSPARSYKRPGIDTAGTNEQVLVKWYGEKVIASVRGAMGAFSVSIDNGLTWNDISLENYTLTDITDIYVAQDGSKWYFGVNDGTNSAVYRYDSSWARVLNLAGANTLMLRAAADAPNALYVALAGGTAIYYTADAGQTRWYNRTAPGTIMDLAAESADVVYVGTGTSVRKSTNQGFTWGGPTYPFSTDSVYSLYSLSANNLIVGGNAGHISYTQDGGVTYTKIPAGVTGTNVMAVADKLDSGGNIYAVTTNTEAVSRYVIGTDTAWRDLFAPTTNGNTTGIALANGVLYTSTNSTTYNIKRNTFPQASTPSADFWDSPGIANSASINANRTPWALKTSTGSIKLWVANNVAAAADTIYTYDDTLADTAPTVSAPADGTIIPLNAQQGYAYAVTFTWTRPSLANNYMIFIALDPFLTQLAIPPITTGFSTFDTNSYVQTGGSLVPGTTYYWAVKASAPISSPFSEIRSFTIQANTAQVPVINAPANGATIETVSPAFSWSPVTGTTKYEFQISELPGFETTVFEDQPIAAGESLPVTIKLDTGKTYFWRVRALEPVEGDWSTVANFSVAEPVTTTTAPPPVTITSVPPPTITIPAPTQTTITVPPPVENQIAPAYIWAIIIIGAILVIAVIVLIVRTRRSV
jgi:hypothetical protein